MQSARQEIDLRAPSVVEDGSNGRSAQQNAVFSRHPHLPQQARHHQGLVDGRHLQEGLAAQEFVQTILDGLKEALRKGGSLEGGRDTSKTPWEAKRNTHLGPEDVARARTKAEEVARGVEEWLNSEDALDDRVVAWCRQRAAAGNHSSPSEASTAFPAEDDVREFDSDEEEEEEVRPLRPQGEVLGPGP